MGQITSSIGLASGIPTGDIIDQLISIEARPKLLIEQRIAVLQSQQVAFQNISAKLLALKLAAGGFLTNKTFDTTTASSSNESVLSATSTTSATPGSYTFIVDRLVSTQQLISQGFVDQDVTAVGAGTLTFEFGDGRLDTDTDLSTLNGGNGFTRGKIRITDRSGASAVIDLSRAQTVNDVLNEINNASVINVTASAVNDQFVLQDASGSTSTTLSVADVGASGTSVSLGLNVAALGNTLTGNQISLLTADTPLSILNDGQGVDINNAVPDHLRFRRRTGNFVNVDMTGVTTIGELMTAVATDTANGITVQIDASGTGLDFIDAGPDLSLTFEAFTLNGSNAAIDLGILGPDSDSDGIISSGRLISSLNSKLVKNLNGGTGVTLGTISFTNRLGMTTNIDLSSAGSISEVITLINAGGAGVTASLNQAANGLLLTDTTGSTVSDLIVADMSGTAAVDLKLAGTFAADTVDSGSLQFRYLSPRTLLGSLNGGQGFSRGKFTITDSSGVTATVDLTQGNEVTIKDVIDEINSRGLLVNARINNNGDGIIIEDLGPGNVKLLVKESGSTTARDLGLLGEATNFGDDLNGSFERTVTISATDTLQDVVTAIGNAGIDVSATIINDGSAAAPYRLNLVAKKGGTAGAFVFDDGRLNFAASTLTQARDALVFFGSSNPANAVAIRSTSNTLATVIPGATIDLKGTDSQAVQITISRDDTTITTAITGFIDSFNTVVSTFDTLDSFDTETKQRGLLLGDRTISTIRSALFRLANASNSDLTGQFTSLAQIGITVGTGAKLQFNATRFQSALDTDRDAVQAMFTFKEQTTDTTTGQVSITAAGNIIRFDELLGNLTDSTTGTVQLRVDSLQGQIDLGNDRIENLDVLLASKRSRLEAQFLTMELAISSIQGQSGALTTLANLANSISIFR